MSDMDPGDCTTRLFPPDETAPRMCGHCHATRTTDCEYDELLALSIERPNHRPKACIAGGQLAPNQPLPYA